MDVFLGATQKRVEIFNDTLNIINNLEQEKFLKSPVNTVYSENEYPNFSFRKNTNCEIELSTRRTTEATLKLHKESPNLRIAVLNFANAYHPGGGVREGSPAQEESICRVTDLYRFLSNTDPELQKFYKYHKEKASDLASERLIFSKDVTVLKNDGDAPLVLDVNDRFNIDVITMAAPDLSNPAIRDFMDDGRLFSCHLVRAQHLLSVAAHNEVDILVLGAFGCGVFQNNPKVVVSAWKTALKIFPKVFQKIEFAIYCGNALENDNYLAFKSIGINEI